MAGYLSDSQVKRDMKYITDINKLGYQNANDKQKSQMYNLRKKYGDTIYKSGHFNANDLSSKNKTLYTKYNPNSGFTRQRQEGFFNTVDDRLKNNQSVSDDQMKSYNEYMKKWNLTPHNKRAITYQDATKQASEQVDPLYQQSLKDLQSQRYQNELNAGEVAANRGLGRSGLAADQLNKIAIATQNQASQLGAERATQIAELATALQQRDEDVKYRDAQFEYQKHRDQIGDKRYNSELAWEKSKYKSESEWRKYAFNNMSASEKAQLEWAKTQYGEDAAWKMFELEYQGELQKSLMDKETELYGSGFLMP